jgi:hypothetical protein
MASYNQQRFLKVRLNRTTLRRHDLTLGNSVTKVPSANPCTNIWLPPAPIIREIQSTGIASHRAIARSLNARGGVWTAVQVGSILRRV